MSFLLKPFRKRMALGKDSNQLWGSCKIVVNSDGIRETRSLSFIFYSVMAESIIDNYFAHSTDA